MIGLFRRLVAALEVIAAELVRRNRGFAAELAEVRELATAPRRPGRRPKRPALPEVA